VVQQLHQAALEAVVQQLHQAVLEAVVQQLQLQHYRINSPWHPNYDRPQLQPHLHHQPQLVVLEGVEHFHYHHQHHHLTL
jgi:hypothetical protein